METENYFKIEIGKSYLFKVYDDEPIIIFVLNKNKNELSGIFIEERLDGCYDNPLEVKAHISLNDLELIREFDNDEYITLKKLAEQHFNFHKEFEKYWTEVNAL